MNEQREAAVFRLMQAQQKTTKAAMKLRAALKASTNAMMRALERSRV